VSRAIFAIFAQRATYNYITRNLLPRSSVSICQHYIYIYNTYYTYLPAANMIIYTFSGGHEKTTDPFTAYICGRRSESWTRRNKVKLGPIVQLSYLYVLHTTKYCYINCIIDCIINYSMELWMLLCGCGSPDNTDAMIYVIIYITYLTSCSMIVLNPVTTFSYLYVTWHSIKASVA